MVYNYKSIKKIGTSKREKNWIPLIHENKELFIYSFSPFVILNNDLTIYHQSVLNFLPNEIIQNLRGSTNFIFKDNKYIGIVHYSNNSFPKRYLHVMIEFDMTFKIQRYSQIFYFNSIDIEFCIGFAVINNKYLMWISRRDRDPLLLKIPIENIFLKLL